MDNAKIEELIERDTAKPLKKFRFAPGCDPIPACPKCGEILVLIKSDHFCRSCGQRLATDEWEL